MSTRSPGAGTIGQTEVGVHYPNDLERRLELKDGGAVLVRPILSTDGPYLRAAMAEADQDTIRNCFLGWRPEPDDELIHHLTHVDYHWRLALVALSPESRGLAIGRYEGKPGEDVAEAAVVVHPGWRRALDLSPIPGSVRLPEDQGQTGRPGASSASELGGRRPGSHEPPAGQDDVRTGRPSGLGP